MTSKIKVATVDKDLGNYPRDGWGGKDGLTYFIAGVGRRSVPTDEKVLLAHGDVKHRCRDIVIKESAGGSTEAPDSNPGGKKHMLHPGGSGIAPVKTRGKSKRVANVTPKIKALAKKGTGVRDIHRQLSDEGVVLSLMTVSRVLSAED